jgi:metal-responsive CopG/Arc/MetJ family transcriptional regulator
MLIEMVEEDGKTNGFANRSAFIRQLIRSENKRRSEERFELTPIGEAQLKLEQDKQAGH